MTKTTDTIRVYDQRATEYAEMVKADTFGDRQLQRFINALPAGGRALDLGCGPGNAAATMAQAGLTVEATDASTEMVSLANKHTGVTATQAVFEDIAGRATYDGVWANFSLLHATRAEFPTHLAALHKALKPGGTFYIGMKLGSGQGPDRIGRFYTYYSQEELEDHMTQAGFTITDRTLGNGVGLDGKPSDWIAVTSHA
ncbi:class I SAM-dependent methyltransferase [Parasedimentitalea marina]|nr:class I SAM-dependent methyltransferase [Parasedimentitalea marina]